MSIRAYKIIQIIQEDLETFNLTHDDFITQNLDFMNGLNGDGCGIATIYRDSILDLQNALNKAIEEGVDEDVVKNKDYYLSVVAKLLKDSDENGGDVVDYMCF